MQTFPWDGVMELGDWTLDRDRLEFSAPMTEHGMPPRDPAAEDLAARVEAL